MNRLTSLKVLLTVIVACTAFSKAQDKPIAEVTGSYQFDHLVASADGVSASANVSRGWGASVNVPVTRWFGVVGDVGEIWKSDAEFFNVTGINVSASGTGAVYSLGAGPQLTYRAGRIQPFGRFLLGDAHSTSSGSVNVSGINYSNSATADSFFIAPGCGVDFRVTHNTWLRAGADYFRTSKYGISVDGIRAFAGITFVFGGLGSYSHRSDQSSLPSREPVRGTQSVPPLDIKVSVADPEGAELTEVSINGVAAKAGLRVSDVITTIDGQPIKTPGGLNSELAKRRSGAQVRIGYLLRGQWQAEVTVTLGEDRQR